MTLWVLESDTELLYFYAPYTFSLAKACAAGEKIWAERIKRKGINVHTVYPVPSVEF